MSLRLFLWCVLQKSSRHLFHLKFPQLCISKVHSCRFGSLQKPCNYAGFVRKAGVSVGGVNHESTTVKTEDCIPGSNEEPYLDFSTFSFLSTDKETDHKIKLIIMEYEVAKQSGEKMPSTITPDQMKELLGMQSSAARSKYLYYLFIIEIKKLGRKQKKEQRRIELEQLKKEREDTPIPRKNKFFMVIRNSSMLKFYNSNQIHSIMFGVPIVFDLAYDEHMEKREKINCAKQLKDSYGANKINCDPFNIYFCNVNLSFITQYVQNPIPNICQDSCMINITESSYLDIFPKDKIVYLTPNAPNELKSFDHRCVYVIGGYVDKCNSKPLSLAKAKKEGIKMAKLPLDSYLTWDKGNKTLTVDQMMNIMLEIKNTNDWHKAFKWVPQRKIRQIDAGVAGQQQILKFNKKDRRRQFDTLSLFND